MAKEKDNFQKRDGKTIEDIADAFVQTLICRYGKEDAGKLCQKILEKIKAEKR